MSIPNARLAAAEEKFTRLDLAHRDIALDATNAGTRWKQDPTEEHRLAFVAALDVAVGSIRNVIDALHDYRAVAADAVPGSTYDAIGAMLPELDRGHVDMVALRKYVSDPSAVPTPS
ncbi:hypothetical protein [Pseudonocardia xishanensis]|uniref:Uncharacterized protein n=1 Tax=Pseudonocardia xishanensis TaxID=630995 RepID=A0ABP8RQW8_9PSEU